MGFVIFMLLIVLAILGCWPQSSHPPLVDPTSVSHDLTLIVSPSCSSLVLICQKIFQLLLYLYDVIQENIGTSEFTCALRATASHEPSSGPPCSSRQTWRGVTDADMCSEILLFSRLLEGLLQEKHIPINAWSIGPGSFPSRYPSFFHPILLTVNYKLTLHTWIFYTTFCIFAFLANSTTRNKFSEYYVEVIWF